MQHVVEISQKHVEWKKPGTKEYKSPIIWNSRREGKKKKKKLMLSDKKTNVYLILSWVREDWLWIS